MAMIGLPKSSSCIPVARHRPRAPAMLRPWVEVLDRYIGMMLFPFCPGCDMRGMCVIAHVPYVRYNAQEDSKDNGMAPDDITLKLRDVRAASGLSLSKVAEITGVSKAMLGQIERGESSPTIATLWKIAKGFQLPLSALIDTVNGDPSVFQTVTFPGSIEVKIVFPFDPVLGAETFHVNLNPNQSHESPAHAAGVTEEVFVLSGTLDILRGEAWVPLQSGQGQRFAADVPHGYRAGTEGAAFLNMHHYAQQPDVQENGKVH